MCIPCTHPGAVVSVPVAVSSVDIYAESARWSSWEEALTSEIEHKLKHGMNEVDGRQFYYGTFTVDSGATCTLGVTALEKYMKNIRDSYIKIRTAIGNEMKDASVHGSLQLYAMDLCGYNLGGDAVVVLDTVHELNDNLGRIPSFSVRGSAAFSQLAGCWL